MYLRRLGIAIYDNTLGVQDKCRLGGTLREFQKLNSSYEWDGHPFAEFTLERSEGLKGKLLPVLDLGRAFLPTPQENFEDFFIWKSLRANVPPNLRN